MQSNSLKGQKPLAVNGRHMLLVEEALSSGERICFCTNNIIIKVGIKSKILILWSTEGMPLHLSYISPLQSSGQTKPGDKWVKLMLRQMHHLFKAAKCVCMCVCMRASLPVEQQFEEVLIELLIIGEHRLIEKINIPQRCNEFHVVEQAR